MNFHKDPEFYNDDPSLPVFERIATNKKRLYSVEDIVQLLLHPALQSSNICCRRVPTSISESVSFVIVFNSQQRQQRQKSTTDTTLL